VERRAKGLCFKCGGKYHPTLHKCPESSLRVLILGEGEMMNEEGEIVVIEEAVVENEEEEDEVEYKCLGVLGRIGEYQTMKIEGKIASVDMMVLIDNGASHNFISPKVTSALGLEITPVAAKRIKLGDGHRVVTKGMCKGVKVKLGTIEVVVDVLVLELGGLDMVFGVAWLSTLGEVVMDSKLLTMQFIQDNQLVKLQGLGGSNSNQGDLNSFLKNKQGKLGMEWWWSQLQSIEANKTMDSQELKDILKEFHEVFKH